MAEFAFLRALVCASAFSLGLAGPVLAEEPIATAPAAGAAAPEPTTPAPPLTPPSAASAEGRPAAMGPCGPEAVKSDGSLETKPHGEVEAGVGTRGYRELAGSVCQPIGQTGVVAVSVGEVQGGYGRR